MRIYGADYFLREWFGGDNEAIHREHYAAQLLVKLVIRITRKDDEIGRYRPLLCDDSWFTAFLDVDDRRLFVNCHAERHGSPSFADTQLQWMQMAITHVQECADIDTRADGFLNLVPG